MGAPEIATEIVADVADEVAEQATHVAEVSRDLSGRNLGFGFGGFIVGAGVGGVLGFIFTRKKLETKYNQLAAEEIAEMREHYNSKATALAAEHGKGDLAELVRNKGYAPDPDESAAPPMAVTPPSAVVDRAKEMDDEAEEEPNVETDPTRLTVDVDPEPVTRNVFRDNTPPEEEWDYHKERSRRSPLKPYVIHRDEREDNEAYDAVSYTYYEADDVVCNEIDEALSPEERDSIVGEANLEKFGHGSGDPVTVFIRNDRLEMDIEVALSPNSYAKEVHGLEPEIKHAHRRRGRTTFDDE